MREDEISLELLGKRSEYADVYTFIFKPQKPVEFEAGQYVHMRVPPVSDGQNVREFSIASAPSDSDVWFTVHVSESPFKAKLAELNPGETVSIFKLRGDFTYPESEKREVVFIAGGIGATPMRSILREREAKGLGLPAVFVHVASAGHLYQEELQGKPMEQHRITRNEIDATLADIAPRKPGALYYVSGPDVFTVTIAASLEELGVPTENIKRDDFTGYGIDA